VAVLHCIMIENQMGLTVEGEAKLRAITEAMNILGTMKEWLWMTAEHCKDLTDQLREQEGAGVRGDSEAMKRHIDNSLKSDCEKVDAVLCGLAAWSKQLKATTTK